MHRNTVLSLGLLASILMTMACSIGGQVAPTQPPEPDIDWQATMSVLEIQLQELEAATVSPAPAVYGLWLTEDEDPLRTSQAMIITPQSVYRLQTFEPSMPGLEPFARETYYEVLEHNEGSGHLSLRIRWIRVNGEFGGFDQPSVLMTYHVEDEVMRFAMTRSDDGIYPEQAGSVEYFRR
jgi:hypothetical protein